MSVEADIQAKLQAGLNPVELDVENESHLHAGHAGSPGTGSSHFRLRVVSEKFVGLNRVARQQLVYGLLKDEMAGPVHALADLRASIPLGGGLNTTLDLESPIALTFQLGARIGL